MSKEIVSHGAFVSYDDAYNEIKLRIANDDVLLGLLSQLDNCPLGRFLIQNRGLNAYWTKVITQNKGGYSSDFENKLITTFSGFNATQERYLNFKQKISNLLSGSKILAVPAGLLPEFSEELILSKKFNIDAYDLDSSCAGQSGLAELEEVNYIVEDVFKMDVKNHYDAVVSNGLNIYLKTKGEVQKFFQILSDSLKQGGVLISSFLIPLDKVDIKDLDKAKFGRQIFVDILNVGWTMTHTEDEFCQILYSCGFDIKEIIYDSQKMFPTIVAIKK
ncbi:class I SAM-dependent methyltransferase [Francisella sp. SYW-9]|uniref:class I SAM-dependent methyltransferase n=1 Tax=Francisella sp. SYW-9 TaxID=2610888 RepID=UPI00123C966E|nr:class I SAM-dependent methyltransferase [Francisella sp. SYW-9]